MDANHQVNHETLHSAFVQIGIPIVEHEMIQSEAYMEEMSSMLNGLVGRHGVDWVVTQLRTVYPACSAIDVEWAYIFGDWPTAARREIMSTVLTLYQNEYGGRDTDTAR